MSKSDVKAWAVEAEGVLIGPFYDIEDAVEYMLAEDGDGSAEFGGKIRPLLTSQFSYSKTSDVRVMGGVKLAYDDDGEEPDACNCEGCCGDSEDSEDERSA